MKKFDIVVVASKLISRQAAQVWGNCNLSDLGSWASGTGFPLEHQGNTDLPYLMCKVSDMNLAGNEIYLRSTVNTLDDTIAQKIGAKIHSKGTVVFPKIGGAIATNKRRILEHPTAIDNNMLGIIPNKNVLSKWLYFLLRGIDFSEFQSGTSVPSVSQKDLGQIKVPSIPIDFQQPIIDFLTELESNPSRKKDLPQLPAPLTEQRRIVEHIESLARRVNEAQSLREEADTEADILINSYLNKSVSDLGQKYKMVFLEELLTDSNYGTSVKCHPERTNDAIPVLRIPNVASEEVTLNDLKYGVLSEAEFNKTVLSEGDILVVRTNGSKDLVGRCAVVPELPEPMAFASYMIRIRSNKEIILPEFLQLVLRQQRTGGYLIDFARTTAGQYNVSLGRLKNTKIPVPPLDEQRRIVAYLDGLLAKVNALRELQSQSQEELDALLPSVLDKAFKGEL